MPRKLPSLNAIRTFEAAARHESFSRAAEELHVTQSAVSRQIQHLEQQLGDALFTRNGPRISLTQSGRDYHMIVEEGLGVIRRGTERLFGRAARPVLTLSIVPSVVAKWLVPRLLDFERKHPDVSLHLSASYELVDFSQSTDIDAGIRFGAGRWPGLAADLLLDDVVFPVCSPSVATRLRQPSDLLNERLLADSPSYDLWEHWLRAAGFDRLVDRYDRLSDDFSVQLEATVQGRGITLSRGMLVADDLRAGRVVCPFPILVPSPLQYYFVCPTERRDEPAIRAIRDWLLETARATAAELQAFMAQHRRANDETPS